jgi:hypothetical protein
MEPDRGALPLLKYSGGRMQAGGRVTDAMAGAIAA